MKESSQYMLPGGSSKKNICVLVWLERWQRPLPLWTPATASDEQWPATAAAGATLWPINCHMGLKEKQRTGVCVLPEVSNSHIQLSTSKDAQHYIKAGSRMLLDLTSETLKSERGIKVSPGTLFHCKIEEEEALYIFEAGLDPNHAKTLQHDIWIYVTCKNNTKVLVGTLSAARPKVQLELMLEEECKLSHSSPRKAVYFNGYQFIPCKPCEPEINQDLWVTVVKPSQMLQFNPLDDGKEYQLLKVYSAKILHERVKLYVECSGEKKLLGELSSEDSSIALNWRFEDAFSLSHTSRTAVVIFWGYTVPKSLQHLNLKTWEVGANYSIVHKPPKRSVDTEYLTYQALLAKRDAASASQLEVNLTSISPVSAPVMSIPQDQWLYDV